MHIENTSTSLYNYVWTRRLHFTTVFSYHWASYQATLRITYHMIWCQNLRDLNSTLTMTNTSNQLPSNDNFTIAWVKSTYSCLPKYYIPVENICYQSIVKKGNRGVMAPSSPLLSSKPLKPWKGQQRWWSW